MSAFRHRDYRIFWTGALLSNSGSWLINLTLPYVLFQLTGSALWVGASVAAQFLPMVLLSPVGGSLADHRPRRRNLLVTQTAMAAVAFALWLVWAVDLRDPVLLLALVALIGALNGVSMPSWQGFVHDLVPREDLLSAVTMNSLQFNAARAIGPAVAGVLLATLGPAWAFGFNAMSFGFVILALLLVRAGRDAIRVPKTGSVARGFGSALRYVKAQPGLLMAMMVAATIGFLGNPIFAFTVVFAGEVFDVGPVALGLLNAAVGIGALAAAPVVGGARWAPSLSRLVTIGLVTYSTALVAFALAPGYAVGLVAAVVIGACFLTVIASTNTATQLIVADSFRGRVLAIRLMTFTLAAPLGSLAWGAASDIIGPRPTVLIAGLLMGAITAFLVTRQRGVRFSRLDDPHDVLEPTEY
ncbi:MAG: MFS transporter [Actinomycetota bacterium]|nr:MFS transporter [Actinomycetota bacterium]